MCVCFNTSFRELKQAGITSLEEAASRFGCGTNCGACVPYIRKMLNSGDTEFAIIEEIAEPDPQAIIDA